MNRCPHAQAVQGRKIFGGQRLLRGKHCCNGISGSRERRAECVANRFEDMATVFGDRSTQDCIVAAHGFLHRRAVAFPSCCAAFDIGEGKGHRTGRKGCCQRHVSGVQKTGRWRLAPPSFKRGPRPQMPPIELVTGSNLLSILSEYAGIESKIEFPDDWQDTDNISEPIRH
ncbi:MAG: hypothetical protein ABSD52_13440 [Candidatus Cybelea sp.]|jgi:hypothetical protein